jgi:hypothetical protein
MKRSDLILLRRLCRGAQRAEIKVLIRHFFLR